MPKGKIGTSEDLAVFFHQCVGGEWNGAWKLGETVPHTSVNSSLMDYAVSAHGLRKGSSFPRRRHLALSEDFVPEQEGRQSVRGSRQEHEGCKRGITSGDQVQVTSHQSCHRLHKLLFRGACETLLTEKQRQQQMLESPFFRPRFWHLEVWPHCESGSLRNVCVRDREAVQMRHWEVIRPPHQVERHAHVRGLVEFQSKENKQVSWADSRILCERAAPAHLLHSTAAEGWSGHGRAHGAGPRQQARPAAACSHQLHGAAASTKSKSNQADWVKLSSSSTILGLRRHKQTTSLWDQPLTLGSINKMLWLELTKPQEEAWNKGEDWMCPFVWAGLQRNWRR